MEKKKVIINFISLVIQEIVVILSSFIVPRLIISNYGSEINGITSSIYLFLSFIVLLEGGISGIIRARFYKPLSKKDDKELTRIISTSNLFFKKLSFVVILYVLVLVLIFPFISNSSLSYILIDSLVIVIAINTFFEYFFGTTYNLLLQSSGKIYITSIIRIIMYILNIIISIILIKLKVSIVIVKLATAILYSLAPIAMNIYCKRNFNILKNKKIDKDIIKNRWDGFAHQLSDFLQYNVDILLLTVITNPISVSVYYVYSLVTNGLKTFLGTITGAILPYFGNVYAKDKDVLKNKFLAFDYFFLIVSSIVFCTAFILIVPFIKVYTSDVTDANYIVPVFGAFLVITSYLHIIKTSYANIVYASNTFRENKKDSYIEAGINIVLSVILIIKFNLIGAVISSLVATLYRIIKYIIYLSNNIICFSKRDMVYKLFINMCTFFLCSTLMYGCFDSNNYITWFINAFIVFIINTLAFIFVNLIFNRREFINIFKEIKIKNIISR